RPRAARRPGRCGIHVVAPVDGVLPAVVVALEPDQQPAAGVGAGDPHGAAHSLAAGVGEAHHVDAWDGVDYLAGRLDLHRVWQSRAGSVVGDGLRHRRGYDRMAVTEDHRPETEQVVDIFVAINVPDS